MGDKTGIEWTDSTWNPIRGCSRVSEGCRHCYAERTAAFRHSGGGRPYEGLAIVQNGKPHWTGKIAFIEKHLLDPLRWGLAVQACSRCGAQTDDACVCSTHYVHRGPTRRSRRIFVNSMSDLFHENVTDEMRDKIFAVMALCPQHTFQVLTKRPQLMLEYLTSGPWGKIEEEAIQIACTFWKPPCAARIASDATDLDKIPLPNVWLGVSVENQATADERIPLLLETPAAVRFISAEPLLGLVDLTILPRPASDFDRSLAGFDRCSGFYLDALSGSNGVLTNDGRSYEEPIGLRSRLDWVICGGESGPGARSMHPDWARSLRDQCVAAGVPFFFKQWGEYLPPMTDGADVDDAQELNCSDDFVRVGKRSAGALLDGVEWKQFPEVVHA